MNNSSSCFVSLELWAPQSNVTCDYLNTAPNANQFHVKEKTFFAFSFFFFLLLLENSNVLSPNNNSENGGIKIESALLCFVVVAFHRCVLVAAALVFEWVWDEWTTGNTCYCCSIAARPQFFFFVFGRQFARHKCKKATAFGRQMKSEQESDRDEVEDNNANSSFTFAWCNNSGISTTNTIHKSLVIMRVLFPRTCLLCVCLSRDSRRKNRPKLCL